MHNIFLMYLDSILKLNPFVRINRLTQLMLKKAFFTIVIIGLTYQLSAEIRLPKLISDGMVLQRSSPLKIWGWGDPGEKVQLTFRQITYTTITDEGGKWSIQMSPQNAGGPYQMDIIGNNKIKLSNILIGDVWICSGQSNMELNMDRVSPLYPTAIDSANFPDIRYFKVPYHYDFHEPKEDLAGGQWQITTPETVKSFGAVAYFFGQKLYEKYQIPIGLINSSMGGSPIEAWMSEDAITPFEKTFETYQKYQNDSLVTGIIEADQKISSGWYQKLNLLDDGLQKGLTNWYENELSIEDWKEIEVPGYWDSEKSKPVNGVFWFRKTFELPKDYRDDPAMLWMGRIVDADQTYINGKLVGNTTYQYPPRRYAISKGILVPGKNTITVRVISNEGRGGFVPDKSYQLFTSKDTIELSGTWRSKVGVQMDPLPAQTFVRWKPVGLYNGMLHPLFQTAMKGIIWYQGESNTGDPESYAKLFPTMISDWRARWINSDFPFLFVQLANFMESSEEPKDSQWARLREAQLQTLSIPNTAMAVTIDIGEWNDIHPLNKQAVSERLALAAMKLAYQETELTHSGPLYKSHVIEDNKIIIEFDHIGTGLHGKGGQLHEFAIAGKDEFFHWAKAKIENDKVIVWSDQVEKPLYVRYAWADNPAKANLYNNEGLPASPFRTDH